MTNSSGESTSVHPQARFRGDLASIIESHSVLHRSPADTWQDGLYLGNGDIAATVHGGPERTRVLLNKGDIWDERAQWKDEMYDPADFDWQRTKAVLTRAIETADWSEFKNLPRPPAKVPEGAVSNYSGIQPAGYLDILGDLPDGSGDFQQKLSFYRALVDCSFRSGDKDFAYTAYTHANHNLLAIDLCTDKPAAWPLSLQLHRDLVPFRPTFRPDPYLADPEFGHDHSTLWMTMVLPDGFAFAVVAQAPGVALDFEAVKDRVTAHLASPSSRQLRVQLTIVTGQDTAPDALVRQGKEDLLNYARDEQPLASHQRWWADFWRKGWISLPEKLIENLWYAEIYKIASCSRKGGQAPGQLAHWSGFPDPPWRGDYHTNINIQEVYWPIYTANRPELGWPFYDLYLNMLDYIVEDTERYTGMPGARFVRGHGRSGRPHGRGAEWELWPGAGAWLCAHFWWHFQFTRDETFLRASYRMMRACLDYFVAYVGAPDENGRYHIIPSVCHEQSQDPPVAGAGSDWGKNSPYDLGIFRDHLMHTIRASEILGVDESERRQWTQLLQGLAPFPVSPDGWLEEWEGVSLWKSHRHLSTLYPIFPGEQIHQDSDAETVRTGRQSVLRFLARGSDGYSGFSFGWMAACAARMGMAEEALSCIRSHIRAFVNVNGYSLFGPSRFPGLAPYPGERRGPEWKTKLPNCESGGSFCAGINELLLRSPSDRVDGSPLIRVFPAIIEAWRDARISRLRAQGAFLVTAERRDGRTAYVLIESEAGVDCRLANPWPGEAVVVVENGESVPHVAAAEVISFATQPGKSYSVCPAGTQLDDLAMVALDGSEDEGCRLGIGGLFEAMPWRDYDPAL